MVRNGVPIRKAVLVDAAEQGKKLTNKQAAGAVKSIRNQEEYRKAISVGRDEMEMRTVELIGRIDKDIIDKFDSMTTDERIALLRVLTPRLGLLGPKEAGITLNVAVVGDAESGKRKMNLSATPADWAFNTTMGEYVHLPTERAVRLKMNQEFKRHQSCHAECQMIKSTRGTFGDMG